MNAIADWIKRNEAYLTGAVAHHYQPIPWRPNNADRAAIRTIASEHKPRARQFYSRVLNRQLWRVHAPKMYDGCGTTLEGALRVFRANNQLT